MDSKLLISAILKFCCGVLLVGLLLFLPAGTCDYWQAWLLLGILFVPMFIAGLVMMARNPALLRSRLNAKEQEKEQKAVVLCSGLMFLAAFVGAGLCRRFGFLLFPSWVSWSGAVVFLAAYALYAEVLRENTWLSRTLEVQEGQQVVDTGMYGVVRHPMYTCTLLLFLSMPLVLGSAVSLAVMLLYIPINVKSIRNEEEVLRRDLAGYDDYTRRVRHRLIPFVW
jgi:protein-S-isoprenylcysteine O-methyltransferase Ste14